ncbi:tRNA methyltransferase complex GCD14 subunit [Patellaria atrata CBS 101060]|uniref:tRNA (adenine(58)-N(1))-methyltransferase catalytic subunit TRM61 n=1 Tax=Patellaria atrata CBS 101060 TaxID=1346257 RepID=A0A9P4SF12_9PEZI|nr:tRNA methyltransferase complex GCD14 subunit [Patellaria atrata CBS 101060]
MFKTSPFLDPGTHSAPNSLALLYLRRDLLQPLLLPSVDTSSTSEAVDPVINTRFGSYPYSTLVNQPWGTQISATAISKKPSKSSTANKNKNKKRKRGDADAPNSGGEDNRGDNYGDDDDAGHETVAGFAHLLPPTPELWTLALPHRTQVVYTPDYSYILQRLRVRPGDVIIEAGAGSGSFTHAAARAVFSGYPASVEVVQNGGAEDDGERKKKKRKRKYGRVCSFEYHSDRAKQLSSEIAEHGLEGIVTVTHRDVYSGGFSLEPSNEEGGDKTPISPNANAVFLDLPAPWLALKHLTRTARAHDRAARNPRLSNPSAPTVDGSITIIASTPSNSTSISTSSDSRFVSPLNRLTSTHLCTFSPCIEQVTATVSALHSLGWRDIDMVEIQHKQIEVRRERIGGDEGGPATVEEAVARLKEVEGRWKEFHDERVAERMKGGRGPRGPKGKDGRKVEVEEDLKDENGKAQETMNAGRAKVSKAWEEGRLVHRTEPELKTHTSYLVFAVLPREWTAEDEEKARRKWNSKK